jgi:GAF domain-containing protein
MTKKDQNDASIIKETTSSITSIEALLKQRDAELAVINSVQQGLVAQQDMQGIYDLVGDKIRDLFDAQVVIIATFNHENGTEIFQYFYEKEERVLPMPRPFDKIRHRLIKTQKLINFNENIEEAITTITGEVPKAVPGTIFPKSMLFVPLAVGNSVQGYVSLQNIDRENAFGDSDVQLLGTLANSLSVALENARLFNETEQRNAELAVINSVQQGLVAEMDMQGIYDLVGDRFRDLFNAQVTAIVTMNLEDKVEHFQYAYEDGERIFPSSRPYDKIREKIIFDKVPLLISENAAQRMSEIVGKPFKQVPGTRMAQTALYVPMIVGDTVKGYVTLQNNDQEHAFSDSDVRLLRTLVNSMSVAIENARLFNETEQRNAELAVINSVQQGLVAEMDMQGIYDLVGDQVRDLFDSQVTIISTFDHEKKTEIFQYFFEEGARLYPESRAYDKIRQRLIISKKLISINEKVAEAYTTITGKAPKTVPGTRFPKSMLFVPLITGNSVRGYVSLQNLDRENAFSESDVSLLNTLVNSMTVALENARLFNETTHLLAETEQRNAELAVINSVQEGLVREMDMEAIYSLVGNRICEVLNTQTMIIRTFNHTSNTETWEYAIENGERLFSEQRPFIWANQHLIKTKESLLINENYVETAKKYGDKFKGVSKGLPPKSAIFVPMMVGGVVMGSVSLQNVEKENVFSESDVRLLNTLTNSMSVALENARLFNETTRLLAETEQRATEMQTVNNISRAMVSQLEFNALVDLVGEQMRETFKADIVYLAIHDRKTNMLHFPYIYGETAESRPFANGISEKIILNKEPLLINQKMDEAVSKIKAESKGTKVQSYLGVPIVVGSKAIGVISVQSTEAENRFNENDQRLLTTIAANLGVAMQNAEAYQKLQAALNELKSAQEQLIQSEKMASLGELTAGIAHEIQNPLNFVNNFSEVNTELIDELSDELIKGNIEEVQLLIKDIRENESKINHHGKRADGIVKGMLQHSRSSSGVKEPTDINALADEYLRLAYHGLRAKDKSFNAKFETDFDPTIGKVEVLSQDMGRVILNLITNAFYTVTEKKKQLSTINNDTDYDPTVTVITKKVGSKIEIRVKDNGNGIPKKVLDKIYQPFFTTKPTGQGTGLGLSMSYDIVTKSHGGELKVVTKENEGTEFIIAL